VVRHTHSTCWYFSSAQICRTWLAITSSA
jgi:hypothetical protein